MSIETTFLNRLKEEQQKFAVAALKQPSQRDAFEYGHRVGMYAGIESAINVLLAILDDASKKEL